jgi:hypothetical protein
MRHASAAAVSNNHGGNQHGTKHMDTGNFFNERA